jgi:hypothetical protein
MKEKELCLYGYTKAVDCGAGFKVEDVRQELLLLGLDVFTD